MSKKKIIFPVSAFLLVIALVALVYILMPFTIFSQTPSISSNPSEYYKYSILNYRIKKKSKECSLYKRHLNAGASYGWPPIKTEAELNELIHQRKLTEVTIGRGYRIGPNLTHSEHYLTWDAYRFLQELGEAYCERAGSDHTFTITSLTRMVSKQKRLTRINMNAANESSHSYGCSFDISYVRFDGVRARNRVQEKILEELLEEYQNKQRILFIKEKKIPCFHITVKRSKRWFENRNYPLPDYDIYVDE
ncbi:MAG: DUF5715 family protein [Bacteroidales bacterium]|jgi:hypothetical protein|nr:DUF5715 family protein [Bacteroidales bacterium]MDD3161179.1 DUF5715 family protein [Bacteroidales bacterium]